MTWRVSVVQRFGPGQEPLGLYVMVAENHREGRLVVGCAHDHTTRKEAAECRRAHSILSDLTGQPVADGHL